MDRPHLTLVRGSARRRARGPRHAWAGAVVLAIAAIAWVAGGGPEGRSAEPLGPDEIENVVAGRMDPAETAARLIELRRHVGRSPLDARTRSGFAALLMVAPPGGPGAASVAAFHARTAMRTAPVTVPVIRRTAAVLIQAGRRDEAVTAIRGVFAFDPSAAARMLGGFAPFLGESEVAAALPDDPGAWRSLAEEWVARDRPGRALDLLERGVSLWPDDPGLVRDAALRFLLAGRREAARQVLLALEPGVDADPTLLALRARAQAWSGDPVAAGETLARAEADAPNDLKVLLHGGDAWLDLGEPAIARDRWERGRYLVPADRPAGRIPFVVRIARTADRDGEAVEALRAWRAVLDLDPAHAEARRRIEAITGLAPPPPGTPPP